MGNARSVGKRRSNCPANGLCLRRFLGYRAKLESKREMQMPLLGMLGRRNAKENLLKKPIVIVATYGRSGSTLLGSLISTGAGYHIAGENNDTLFGLFLSTRALKTAQRRAHRYRTGENEPWHMIDKANADRYAQRLMRAFFEEVVQPPANAKGLGFKEIRFFDHPDLTQDYLQFIVDTLKTAKIVFNIRAHDEVAKSGWYKKQDPAQVKQRLEEQEAAMRTFLAKNPDRAFLCDYNQYTADPDSLRSLFDFLGVRFAPDLVRKVLGTTLMHGKEGQSRKTLPEKGKKRA